MCGFTAERRLPVPCILSVDVKGKPSQEGLLREQSEHSFRLIDNCGELKSDIMEWGHIPPLKFNEDQIEKLGHPVRDLTVHEEGSVHLF